MKRTFMWFLLNGIFGLAIYLAYFQGVAGAERVAIFWAWALFVMSPVYMHSDVVDKMRERGRALPQWIDVLFDMSVVVIFVWFGAIFTGAAYLIHFVFYSTGWSKAEEKKDSADPEEVMA